jgi:hypothetical protein
MRLLRILLEGRPLDLTSEEKPTLIKMAPRVYRYIPPTKRWKEYNEKPGKVRRLSRIEIDNLLAKGGLHAY